MLLIKNGKILTMADKDFDTGDILIDDGKIVDIDDSIIADGAEVFDAKGCTIIPGIVDPHCHIGMWEDGIDKEGADGNEMTDPITPELRAIDAINPLDRCFREALEGGVTTVVTGPGQRQRHWRPVCRHENLWHMCGRNGHQGASVPQGSPGGKPKGRLRRAEKIPQHQNGHGGAAPLDLGRGRAV